ncbi:protein kinase domain-containing protein [Candidatus Protochlamydia amoebophila]|uniref:Putative calcium-dependent protein kinase 9 n=1 Tax=Candidatus Protochlamydia amoebophila TaxID=362787 RepID=A0A0C1JW37_9BACT|nr:protein kinase [Candidatus Protochlamydia amoebophila]KIC71457.1 putative calcium-dependent protein kinase 9 [Candidatus Protochlamydia amoebophila]
MQMRNCLSMPLMNHRNNCTSSSYTDLSSESSTFSFCSIDSNDSNSDLETLTKIKDLAPLIVNEFSVTQSTWKSSRNHIIQVITSAITVKNVQLQASKILTPFLKFSNIDLLLQLQIPLTKTQLTSTFEFLSENLPLLKPATINGPIWHQIALTALNSYFDTNFCLEIHNHAIFILFLSHPSTVISQGRYKNVYKIFQLTGTPKLYAAAITTILKRDSEAKKLKEMQINEERFLTNLASNPQVVKTYSIHYYPANLSFDERQVIIMEYCPKDLRGLLNNLIDKREKLTSNQKYNCMFQLLQFLNDFHSNGYLHRDIKPDNILIKNLQLKFIDFGYSCHITEKEKLMRRCGTFQYLPIEIFEDLERPFGQEKDMWGAACIIWLLFYENLYPWYKVISSDEKYLDFLKKEICDFRQTITSLKSPTPLDHLLFNLLDPDPRTRWTASQAFKYILKHKKSFYEEKSICI